MSTPRATPVATCLALLALAAPAAATTIHVTPADPPATAYAAIEGAMPGDEVVIAPGTYRFRVHLTRTAPADRPIVIRAEDPARRPVWDLTGTLVEDAPGSYTGGDRGRGCWQIAGGTNYQISGIAFTGCRTASFNAAGIRYFAGARGIVVRDCVFRQNDDGMTGGDPTTEMTVEFSEFDRNGNPAASLSSPTHNLYIYGGAFTLRYSYVHDSVQGQNFHVRAHNGLLEYNWIARARNYEGDLMTGDNPAGSGPYTQTLTLRGNVIVQSASPDNRSFLVGPFNDGGAAGVTFVVRMVNNTFVLNGGATPVLSLNNADGTMMRAELSNNVVAGTSQLATARMMSAAMFTGTSNWAPTGTTVPGGISGTVFGAAPGFTNAGAMDFTLAAGSPAIGRASAAVMGLPDHEYYRDEVMARMYRLRTSVHDLGAFESTTTGTGVGPYGAPPPPPDGGTPPDAAPALDATAPGPDSGGTPPDAPSPGGDAASGRDGSSTSGDGGAGGTRPGCGCRAVGNGAGAPGSAEKYGAALVAALLAAGASRRRRGR